MMLSLEQLEARIADLEAAVAEDGFPEVEEAVREATTCAIRLAREKVRLAEGRCETYQRVAGTWQRERDAALARAEKAEAERDEALAQAREMQSVSRKWQEIEQEALAKRDEAWEETRLQRARAEAAEAEVERLRAQAVPEWAASAPLDEVRAWLDGRGGRSVAHYLDVGWEAHLWGDRGTRIARARAETEEAALRALAAQVAGGEGLVRIFPASQEMVPASALDAAQSEAARLRRALEWLAREAERHTGECPFSLESYDGNAECAVVARGEVCRDTDEWWRCWYEAALAAAEEATP